MDLVSDLTKKTPIGNELFFQLILEHLRLEDQEIVLRHEKNHLNFYSHCVRSIIKCVQLSKKKV